MYHSLNFDVSIAYGVIAGVLSYLLLNGIPLVIKRISGGRLLPSNYEDSEKWTVPPGGIVPAWMYALLFS